MDSNVLLQLEARRKRRAFVVRAFGVALAALSCAIYAYLILTLPQIRHARYCCEQSGIAAAISNVMYGARPGSLYTGVFDYLIERFDKPLDQTLDEMAVPAGGFPSTAPGTLQKTTRDGNGVGYPLFATVAFRLFGLHTWGLAATMLALMVLSSVAFLLRWRDAAYAGVVTLYFTVLTLMLFTQNVWEPSWATQIAVGGMRYFSLVSVLPTFHILLELLFPNASKRQTDKREITLLCLQTVILTLAILVRGSALSLIGAIALVWMFCMWRRQAPDARRALLVKGTAVGLTSVGVLAIIVASVSSHYFKEGRLGTVVWMRVTESLGVNPTWPFPGVSNMFDCSGYVVPPVMQPGTSDANGGCIYWDYIKKHNLPLELGSQPYGTLYETAMRDAFFRIAAHYPGDVLKTFIYYKPLIIVQSIRRSLNFQVGKYPPVAVALLIVSLVTALVHFSFSTMATRHLQLIAEVTLVASAFCLPAYLAAWARPHTSIDLLFYCLFGAGLGIGTILMLAFPLVRQR